MNYTVASAKWEIGEVEYVVTFCKVGELNTNSPKIQNGSIQFMNFLVKHMLRDINLTQLGSMRNVYDPSRSQNLQGFPFQLIPGYFTSINEFKSGLQLTIDLSHKIMRVDSVLDYFQECMKEKGGTYGRQFID